MKLDDMLYPLYLEYGYERNGFYDRHVDEIRNLFGKVSDGGHFSFRWTVARTGERCYSVDVVYKGRLIRNRVGYRSRDIALMSVVDCIRLNRFENI